MDEDEIKVLVDKNLGLAVMQMKAGHFDLATDSLQMADQLVDRELAETDSFEQWHRLVSGYWTKFDLVKSGEEVDESEFC